MKTIFILILVLLAGLLFGFLLVKLFIKFSNWLLKRQAKKEILKTKPENDKFFFKQKQYSLKEQIEYDLSKHKTFFQKIKGLFKRKVKGGNISGYGEQPTNTGFKREQVSTSGEGNKPGTEQPSTNTAESIGEQRGINSGLS
jgi:hypothetical protein